MPLRVLRRAPILLAVAIFVLASAVRPLPGQTHYESLAWTPDGSALTISVNGDLYILPLQGDTAFRLTDSEDREVGASWSPDGMQVAFASGRNGHSNILVADAGGTSVRTLTAGRVRDSWPAWSPTGDRIAFMRKDGEHWQLWLMEADGSSQRQLIQSPANDYNPRWSPDGEWIVFETDRHGGDQDEIHVVRADGTGERRLTHTSGNDIFPEWSPTGSRIAYCTIEDGRAFIRSISADGSGSRMLVADACHPVWSPDGTRLAFVAVRRGEPEQLWVANADGSGRSAVQGLAERTARPEAPAASDSAEGPESRPRSPRADVDRPNVAILIYDGVQIIDHAAPWEVLGQYSLNNVYTVAKDTAPVTTFMGMRVLPSYGFDDHPPPDVVVIPGGNAAEARNDPRIIDWVRRHAAASRYVLGICSGVGLLAETGLLAGREATTFYNLLDDLAADPSGITVIEDRLVVEDGKYITTTGTGIEGALRISELLHGEPWTRVVSLNMEFQPIPADLRTPRSSLADMNLPTGIYGAFPWRSAELTRYDGNESEWAMTWRFEAPDPDVLAAEVTERLSDEGWRPTGPVGRPNDPGRRTDWTLRGRDGAEWTGVVRLSQLSGDTVELAVEVARTR